MQRKKETDSQSETCGGKETQSEKCRDKETELETEKDKRNKGRKTQAEKRCRVMRKQKEQHQ